MALRRKTAYEEWAARYRSGKLAPKDNATTMSGVSPCPAICCRSGVNQQS